MSVSVIILTKNEEQHIEACLQSLTWADELIIIDDNSQDNTVTCAKKYTDKVYTRALSGDFAAQRNFGLSKAKNKWVMFIDADERVSAQLSREVQDATKNDDIDGYFIKRDDVNFGHHFKYGETASACFMRLAKKDAGTWQREVHETWEVKGKTATLTYPLLHYSHPTVEQFIEKINTYTTIDAKIFYEQGKHAAAWQILVYPIGKFVVNFIMKQGFRDGVYGLIMAGVMSVHSFLTRAKLWFMWKKDTV